MASPALAVSVESLTVVRGGSPVLDGLSLTVAAGGPYGARFVLDVSITIGATLVALALGAVTLKRRTP